MSQSEAQPTEEKESPISSLTIVEPKEEPIDPFDELLDGNQLPFFDDFPGESLFKEEEIDYDFEVNNATIPIEQSPNELPSNEMDSHRKVLNSSLKNVEPKEEPIGSIDQIVEGIQMPIVDDFLREPLFKEEEMDYDFDANNTTLLIEQSLNEMPSNDNDSHLKVLNSSPEIVEPKEEPIDPFDQILDGTQVPLFDDFLREPLFKEEEIDFDFDVNNSTLSIEQSLKGYDTTVHRSSDPPNDTSGEVKKIMRPTRTLSRPARYTESIDELEPLVKKPRIKSEKKIDSRESLIVDALPKMQRTTVTKINHTHLECPKCEYRSRSVWAWKSHLRSVHFTTIRESGLALLCECGHESFSEKHYLKCDISKVTVVSKSPTPKCVMCEKYPKTAYGYTLHLKKIHKSTLIQMGIILICSCGYKVRSHHVDPEHNKICNGHAYTLHKVDDQ